jgi:hypothetical protein
LAEKYLIQPILRSCIYLLHLSKRRILNIEKIIKQLFIEKSQVVIPGIGTLYSQYQKAQFKSDRKIIDPPGYKIGFNPLLKSDLEHELEDYLSARLKLTAEESKTRIDQFVQQLIEKAEKNEKALLADLGYFYLDPQSKILSFHNNTDKSFLPETFGLHSIDADPILQLDEPDNRNKSAKAKSNKKHLIWYTVSALLVLCFAAGYIIIKHNRVDTTNHNNSIVTNNESIKRNNIVIDSSKIDKRLDSNYTSATKTKNALYYKEEKRIVDAIVDSLTTSTEKTKPVKTYYIIAGSFSNLKNAKKLYKTLLEDGYSPEILSPDTNIFRVSLNKYTSLHQAVNELNHLKSKNIGYDVWISTR